MTLQQIVQEKSMGVNPIARIFMVSKFEIFPFEITDKVILELGSKCNFPQSSICVHLPSKSSPRRSRCREIKSCDNTMSQC